MRPAYPALSGQESTHNYASEAVRGCEFQGEMGTAARLSGGK